MSLSETDVESIAARFLEARRTGKILEAFPGPLPETLADAYRVQERGIALDGRRVVGWKVAMIRPDFRAALGADRLCGPVFEGLVHELPSGGVTDAPVLKGGFAALEAEFVARFARTLEAGADGFSEESIAAALAGLHAGSEIASSPLPQLNEIGPIAVTCDRGNNAGAVVGPELLGWRTKAPESLTSQMLIKGKVAGEGSAAKVPGGPLGALKFLAENLKARGRYLEAGMIVLTGMTTGIHEVTPGDEGCIVFFGVPECRLRVTSLL